MPILSSIVNWLNIKRIHQIDLFRRYPADVQREGLISLLDWAKNTVFGAAHKFSEIRTPEQFQQQVPIASYEDLQPMIMRVMEGEQKYLLKLEK